ncbi:MAG: hypothetical protein ACHQYP_06420 [Nitrospiria bacterium]
MKKIILLFIFFGILSAVAFAGTRIEIEVPLVVPAPAPAPAPPPPVYQAPPPPVTDQPPPPAYEEAPTYEPGPPPAYEQAPPPVMAPPPAPVPPFVAPPLMVWDPRFGMYFALGSPYDLFYYGGYYFVYTNFGWHRSFSYNGPWIYTEREWLPPVFHRYSIEGIRHYREGFYRDYQSRPYEFRDRRFDHHEDRFHGAYDRGFMEHNHEQMQKDRAFHDRYYQNPEHRGGPGLGPEHRDQPAERREIPGNRRDVPSERFVAPQERGVAPAEHQAPMERREQPQAKSPSPLDRPGAVSPADKSPAQRTIQKGTVQKQPQKQPQKPAQKPVPKPIPKKPVPHVNEEKPHDEKK